MTSLQSNSSFDSPFTLYVLDILKKPAVEFTAAQDRGPPLSGTLQSLKADVADVQCIDKTISNIADKNDRLAAQLLQLVYNGWAKLLGNRRKPWNE